MDEGSGKGLVAGLAVSLGGGIVVIGLLLLFFNSLDNKSGGTKTVTVAQTAAAPAATAPATTAPATTAGQTAAQSADVVLGARTYVAFACGACHGWQGQGTPSAGVPALTTAGTTLTAAQMRDIINKGAGVAADPQKPFMPVWGAVISDDQVNSLIAYIKAGLPQINGIVPPDVPAGATPAAAGSILYQKYGCINCHGPNGLGGVPNPSSPDKSVPPLSGADFQKQFNTPQKIASVILDGSVIGSQPIVSMPHWRGILTDAEVAQLVAFIQTLKAK
jgi:mono/diheme cytochrome c family protein